MHGCYKLQVFTEVQGIVMSIVYVQNFRLVVDWSQIPCNNILIVLWDL